MWDDRRGDPPGRRASPPTTSPTKAGTLAMTGSRIEVAFRCEERRREEQRRQDARRPTGPIADAARSHVVAAITRRCRAEQRPRRGRRSASTTARGRPSGRTGDPVDEDAEQPASTWFGFWFEWTVGGGAVFHLGGPPVRCQERSPTTVARREAARPRSAHAPPRGLGAIVAHGPNGDRHPGVVEGPETARGGRRSPRPSPHRRRRCHRALLHRPHHVVDASAIDSVGGPTRSSPNVAVYPGAPSIVSLQTSTYPAALRMRRSRPRSRGAS